MLTSGHCKSITSQVARSIFISFTPPSSPPVGDMEVVSHDFGWLILDVVLTVLTIDDVDNLNAIFLSRE